MKSHHLSKYARIALVVAVAGVMTACVSSPHYYDPDPYYSPRVVYHDYWYYPAIGAYYDPRARIYIYHEHNHWIRARALPPHIRPHLGHHVTVRSRHDRPYEEHHRHRHQYQPERYRERDHTHRGNDAWIGAPRHQNPQPDRNDRSIENHDRDRNGKDRRHENEHGTVAVPSHYRGRDVKYPQHAPDTRPRITPRHREPTVIKALIKREDRWRQPEIHREKSREQNSNGDRRNNDRRLDHGRSNTRTGQPGQYRVPDSHGRLTRTPPQAAPGHREPRTRTVPTKQDDKRHQRENRKEDTKQRYREGGDRRRNVYDDAASQKRHPIPFDQFEQYR